MIEPDSRERVVRERIRLQQLRETEVRQLRVAALREQDVLGLDVAVQDARLVRGRDRVRDAGQQLDDRPPAVRPSRPLPQRAAVHVLGDQVLPLAILAGVVHGHDVRMIQRRRHLRFALEAPAGFGIRETLG